MVKSDDTLEMIVDIRDKGFNGALVVSTCVEQNGKIRKRWMAPFACRHIKPGSVGVFKGDDEFVVKDSYWNTEYDIAVVRSVFKERPLRFEPAHDYMAYGVYSPKGGFNDTSTKRCHLTYDFAKEGNLLLLTDYYQFVANLTAEENIYDLCHFQGLYKYGIAKDIVPGRYLSMKTYRRVIPAVVRGCSLENSEYLVCIPEYPDITELDLVNNIRMQPGPRPSDVIQLAVPDKEKERVKERVLEKNLTVQLQTMAMDEKFGATPDLKRMWEQKHTTVLNLGRKGTKERY